jgi:hypothetical protein
LSHKIKFSIKGLLMSGSIGLGFKYVRGRILFPLPPASIIAFNS